MKKNNLKEFLESFSIRLREIRIEMKLNQTQFGELGGVSLSAQACYENGMRYPNIYYLGKLASNSIDVDYIITGKSKNKGIGKGKSHEKQRNQ